MISVLYSGHFDSQLSAIGGPAEIEAMESDPLDFSVHYFLGASHVAGKAFEAAHFWFQQA